jgi:hypothetical protein
MATRSGRSRRNARLGRYSEEVVGVGERAVLNKQRVTAEPRTLGDDDSLAVAGELHLSEDLERHGMGVGRGMLRHLRGSRVVGVLTAGRDRHVVFQGESFLKFGTAGSEIAKREYVVGAGFSNHSSTSCRTFRGAGRQDREPRNGPQQNQDVRRSFGSTLIQK